MFEKLFHDQLFECLTASNLLSSNSFACCKLHSTTTSLLNLIDTLYENIGEERINVSLFLELGKVFDTIDHNILSSKLGKYGITQKELAWFASYVTDRKLYCYPDRKLYCYLAGKNSKKQEVTCDIPQGSYLGLLLFILYTNDFENSLSTFYPNMYAVNTSIIASSENPPQLLEHPKGELEESWTD